MLQNGSRSRIELTVDYLSKAIFDQIYPVGSIYVSISASLPSTFKGTWEKLASGRALWNVTDNSQLAQSLDGSLPNIYGELDFKKCGLEGASGAFTRSGGTDSQGWGGGGSASDKAQFTASNYNKIYAAAAGTNVVRPTSIGCSMWKRTA